VTFLQYSAAEEKIAMKWIEIDKDYQAPSKVGKKTVVGSRASQEH